MKVIFTMNMASGANDLSHQLIARVQQKNIIELVDYMEKNHFVVVEYMKYQKHTDGTRSWRTLGPMVLGTAHIGKVAEYYDPAA